MSRVFIDLSSHYLEVDASVGMIEPFSISCWYRPSGINVGGLVWFGDKDSAAKAHYIWHRFFVTHFVAVTSISVGGVFHTASISPGGTLNEWNHVLGVWATVSNRKVYLNGSAPTTNTDGVGPITEDRISVGRLGDSTPSNHFVGSIGEVAFWNVALNDNDAVALAAGWPAQHIRANNLVHYYNLYGTEDPEPDTRNGFDLTVNGAILNKRHPHVAPPFAWASHRGVWTQRVSSPHRRRMAATHKKPC